MYARGTTFHAGGFSDAITRCRSCHDAPVHFGLGPFLKFNWDLTDISAASWIGFGASATLKL